MKSLYYTILSCVLFCCRPIVQLHLLTVSLKFGLKIKAFYIFEIFYNAQHFTLSFHSSQKRGTSAILSTLFIFSCKQALFTSHYVYATPPELQPCTTSTRECQETTCPFNNTFHQDHQSTHHVFPESSRKRPSTYRMVDPYGCRPERSH